jgi:signal transduction histidine kinase
MAQDELDLLYLCAPDGRVVWGEVHDWRTGRALGLRDLPRERLSSNHAYLVDENVPRSFEAGSQRGFISGLIQTEHGPMLLSARPVLPSDGTGGVRGTLILGRFLSAALVEELGQRNSVDLAVWPVDSGDMPPAERAILPRVTASFQPVSEARGERVLDVYTTLPDMRRAPALLVRARVPREIWAQANVAARYALLSTVAAGLIMLLVLLAVLQRQVLSPIGRLTAHAVRIGQTEDASEHLDLADGREDEVGILAREFEAMLHKLALSRAAVVETARRSGMSEIANGILHNVGNVLNSVNVSAGVVAERVRSSSAQRLTRLAGLVEEHADDLGDFITSDPRGRHLGPYLGELSRLMASEREQMQREVGTLNEGIEHIRQLVSSHQAYAGRSGLREPVDLRKELENALRISEQACEASADVEISWHVVQLPAVRLDRHRLLEILVNLVKNAREAMGEVQGQRRLLLAIECDQEAGCARIEVSDSGPGISSADPSSVFQHGFTTKASGHGFGLHSSANAAKELGGSLTVRSPGELGGATFTLELPLIPAPTTAQTEGDS